MSPRKLKIRPDPDFSRLEKVITRKAIPDRVPFFELLSNLEEEVLETLGRAGNKTPLYGREEKVRLLQRQIDYMYHLGYDYISLQPENFEFPRKQAPKTMTAQGEREYFPGAFHTIADRRDFESYPWPRASRIDYSLFEKAAEILPQGMKIIASFSGILENVMWLLGYEGSCYLLYEDEELVRDMFDSVAAPIIEYYDKVSDMEEVGALLLGEDMGFKTQVLLSPEIYRKYLFPWHRKLVQTVHSHGKAIILHSCGNLSEVMEDIIGCGWDARHSFEDVIEPVWEAKEKYCGRIAVLGGFDVDKICRMTVPEIRAHTRFLIEKCAPGGGWALGTGNSVANYVPVENFLAMLEEGYAAGFY
jgi:uroporphyrinogen decarboxylase